jgi:anaerobic ribonucleoside-triphosphate reductase activating protein
MNIIINSINYQGSIVDGPGIRTILYVQGCEKQCDGCHNRKTWNIKKGTSISIVELVAEISKKSINNKLTISGGEPLLQVSAILELVKKMDGFSIALYTGFDLEDVPKELLEHLEYIKVGRYEKNKRCITVDYIGSTNQQFIDLQRLRNEKY